MRKVIIATDSTCDLETSTIIDKDIKVIPLYVNFSEEQFKDGVDITTPLLYKMVEERKILPKTAAVSAFEFEMFFKSYVDKDCDIIYIGISSKFSSTINNARLAAKVIGEDRVFVVDSLNLSTGIGLIVLKACKFRDMGFSPVKICEELSKIIPNVRSQFAIETLDYLHKGGRCSSIAALFGGILKLKPIIEVRDGGMVVGKKPMGMKKALNLLLEQIYKDKDKLDADCVMVTHSLAAESCEYLKSELKKNINVDLIMETNAGCVISSHCGRGTIGILYIIK